MSVYQRHEFDFMYCGTHDIFSTNYCDKCTGGIAIVRMNDNLNGFKIVGFIKNKNGLDPSMYERYRSILASDMQQHIYDKNNIRFITIDDHINNTPNINNKKILLYNNFDDNSII